jgi:chromosomal replication initiation ATPase DnaA
MINTTSVGKMPKKRTLSLQSKIHIDYIDKAFQAICDYYNVSPELMKSKAQSRPIVFYRQCAMKYMFEHIAQPIRVSQDYIGKVYFNRDHTTIVHARKLLDNFRDINDSHYQEYLLLFRHMSLLNFRYSTTAEDLSEYPTMQPYYCK